MSPEATEIWQAFRDALDELDIDATFGEAGGHNTPWDAEGEIEGVRVVIEIKVAPSAADVSVLQRRRPKGPYRILVARRLSRATRDNLARKNIGYYDTLGHLRLWQRPMLVDMTEAPHPLAAESPGGPLRLDSASILDVALAVLDGSASTGVRSTAALIGRAPGTVSKQLARLRAAHLVTDGNEPVVPDLFDAVLEVWHPHRVPLATLPPHSGASSDRLRVNADDQRGEGWVLADAHAGAAWGVPVVIAGDSPPDFYVPSAQIVGNARTLLGRAEFGSHACTVAVAPAPYVCGRRFDRSPASPQAYLAPSPVVAALDLAHDPGRGRETLERWSQQLPSEVHRVW